MPRISRKTALALGVSASLVIGAGGMATAAVLKLPAFGFGSAAGHAVSSRADDPADRLPRSLRHKTGRSRAACDE